MSDVRWGILGTGGIARLFVSDLLATGFAVTAVGSRTQESADRFAAEFGIAHAHSSYEALAADPDVDIVYVSTPHPYHAQNALLVLDAGKHALVEKPFTINAAEARQVVARAEQNGLVVLEAMWTRWLPHMVRLREVIASGAIGEVRTVIADHMQLLPSDPAHRINAPELGGGALLDLGIYPVSFAWDILGEPSSVYAISSPTPTGVDRQTAMVFGYPAGQQALIQTQMDARGPNVATVVGTGGRIDIDSVWYTATSFSVYDGAGQLVDRFDEPITTRGMEYQAWEAERLVGEGRIAGEILPPAETVAIMGTLDEIRSQIGLRYPNE